MSRKDYLNGKFFAGLDLGGTTIKGMVVDGDGNPMFDRIIQIPSRCTEGPEVSVMALVQLKEELENMFDIDGGFSAVGLASPGPATKDGVILRAGNLKHNEWNEFPLRKKLEEALGIPVYYGNDGTLAVYGESSQWPKADVVSGFAVGTGIGAGHVINGRPLIGANGFAAESGHIKIPKNLLGFYSNFDFSCSCSSDSCIEAFCSIQGIKTLLPKLLREKQNAGHVLAFEQDNEARARKVLGLANKGDELCKHIIGWQGYALGVGISQIAHDLDPDVFIISGGICEVSEDLWNFYYTNVVDGFQAVAMSAFHGLNIVKAKFGDNAGSIGAALWARMNHAEKRTSHEMDHRSFVKFL